MKRILCLCVISVLLLTMLCGCVKTKNPVQKQTLPSTVTVTFPEGKTVLQIAKLLEQNGVCSADDFLIAVNGSQSDLAQSLGGADRPFLLEGYVFPDTYEFYIGEDAASALSRFLKNTERKITEEDENRAREIGMTMDEVLTLASIIQSEAGMPSEMANVSAVLHNRLKIGMRLQCDVTYFYLRDSVMPYLCPDSWDDAVYERYADAYYTYRVTGLPGGPICNPGKAAIDAALYPANRDELYFFSDKDGQFHYSSTLQEHDAAIARFG